MEEKTVTQTPAQAAAAERGTRGTPPGTKEKTPKDTPVNTKKKMPDKPEEKQDKDAVEGPSPAEKEWEEKYGILCSNAPISDKLAIIRDTIHHKKPAWARKCMTDAACGRLGRDKAERSELSKAGKEALYYAIIDYVYKMIHERAETYVATTDSRKNSDNLTGMVNTAFVEIYSSLENYDPMRGALTTYFKKRIINGIAKWVDQEHRDSSPAVSGRANRVRKAMEQLTAEGKAVTPAAIQAKLPGFSVAQIVNLQDVLRGTESRASLEDDAASVLAAPVPGPEEQAIINERNDELYRAIEGLDDDERTVYCLMTGLDLETRELSGTEKNTTDMSRIMGMSTDDISKLKTRLIQKLQRDVGKAQGRTYERRGMISLRTKIPFLDDPTGETIDEIMDSTVSVAILHHNEGGGIPEPPDEGTPREEG